MERRIYSYRRKAPDVVQERIQRTLSTTMYVMQTIGPTSYVLKEPENETKFRVCIGHRQLCSCSRASITDEASDLCCHVLFVMLKIFRVPATNPLVWQRSLLDSEVAQILSGVLSTTATAHSSTRRQVNFLRASKHQPQPESSGDLPEKKTWVAQQTLVPGEVCAICQEEMIEEHPLTYCRTGCGNNFHIECMKIYGENRRQSKENILCPLCRENWGGLEAVQRLKSESKQAKRQRNRHSGTRCQQCQCLPIYGTRYRCVECIRYDLCTRCFNHAPTVTSQSMSHDASRHHWIQKEQVQDQWTPVPSAQRHPSAWIQELQSRELSTLDYDLLLSFDHSTTMSEYLVQLIKLQKFNGLVKRGNSARRCAAFGCAAPESSSGFLIPLECHHMLHESCLMEQLTQHSFCCPAEHCSFILFPGLHSLRKRRQKKKAGPDIDEGETQKIPALEIVSSTTAFMPARSTADQRQTSRVKHKPRQEQQRRTHDRPLDLAIGSSSATPSIPAHACLKPSRRRSKSTATSNVCPSEKAEADDIRIESSSAGQLSLPHVNRLNQASRFRQDRQEKFQQLHRKQNQRKHALAQARRQHHEPSLSDVCIGNLVLPSIQQHSSEYKP